ncbi:MAG: hypothetical protein ACXWNR_07115 [Candidatus Limnocylindrales bacterium]
MSGGGEGAAEVSVSIRRSPATARPRGSRWPPPSAPLAWWQGRVITVQRWFRWLEDRGGIEGHPMAAVLASMLFALTARPVEAGRWADAVDRWQYQPRRGPMTEPQLAGGSDG